MFALTKKLRNSIYFKISQKCNIFNMTMGRDKRNSNTKKPKRMQNNRKPEKKTQKFLHKKKHSTHTKNINSTPPTITLFHIFLFCVASSTVCMCMYISAYISSLSIFTN